MDTQAGIRFTLSLYSYLRTGSEPPGGVRNLQAPSPVAVERVLKEIGVRGGEVYLILRNGARMNPADLVRDGDRIEVFPFVGGG